MASHTLGVRVPEGLMNDLDRFVANHGLNRSKAIVYLIEKALRNEKGFKMSYAAQDQVSGARANDWGRATARRVGDVLGAEPLSDVANEFNLDGKRVTIRCAKPRTTQVGLYDSMRDRIDYIIGAFQTGDDCFQLFRVTPSRWKDRAHDAAPSNPNRGRITFLSRSTFQRIGEDLGKIGLKDEA